MLKNWPVFAVALACLLFSIPAYADGSVEDLIKLINKSGTPSIKGQARNDGALRLTSNRDEIISLDQDAASVIVNNPEHAEVMLDSPRLLIVMPRKPGATSFKVLNSNSETILEKDIIVTNTQPQYVRVRRVCAGNDATCVPAAYYYCPDGCYEVTPAAASSNNSPPPPVSASTAPTEVPKPESPTTNPVTPENGNAAPPPATGLVSP